MSHVCFLFILQAASEVRYIQNRDEKMKILKACHLDPTAGHLGVKELSAHCLE